MARMVLIAVTPEVALAAATAKTVLLITAPAQQRLALLEWAISGDSTSPTAEPMVVEVARFTTSGTFTSLTPVKQDPDLQETIQSTAGHTATVEPSIQDVLERIEVHPASGYVWTATYAREHIVQGGGRLGLRVTAPAIVNVIGRFLYEE